MSSGDNTQVTQLLHAISEGDDAAPGQLLAVVYEELRELARRKMRRIAEGQTLQPTALVNEAYLRLVDGKTPSWENRAHFFGSAARAMRDILVEQARRKSRRKHGGDRDRLPFDERLAVDHGPSLDIIALDEALDRLERTDEELSTVVMLRYFAGLSIDRTAEVMGISGATVERRWSFARAWLHRELTEGGAT